MPDDNMRRAYKLAKMMARRPRWYKKYRKQIDPQMVAAVVHSLDFPLVQGKPIHYGSVFSVMTIFLRWWSGCISMAKVIALETRDCANTPKDRKKWSRQLLSEMKKDPIFADGVHAAISLKRLRNQKWSFNGFDDDVFKKMVDKRDVF